MLQEVLLVLHFIDDRRTDFWAAEAEAIHHCCSWPRALLSRVFADTNAIRICNYCHHCCSHRYNCICPFQSRKDRRGSQTVFLKTPSEDSSRRLSKNVTAKARRT